MEHVDLEKVWLALVVLEYDDEGENVTFLQIDQFDTLVSTNLGWR